VLQQWAADYYGGATVPASLDSERVVEMAWEHPWLTLVLAVPVVEAERAGAELAMCDQAMQWHTTADTATSAAPGWR
jgi:hypothetical protein